LARRIEKAFQNSIDPEAKETGRTALYFAALLAGVAVIVAGYFYCKAWLQRREEWALNDPMALVQELNTVHQLSEQEKRLMQELSTKNSLASPLKLFVEPKFLLECRDNDSFAFSRPTARALLSKLFDITSEGNDISAALGGTNTYYP